MSGIIINSYRTPSSSQWMYSMPAPVSYIEETTREQTSPIYTGVWIGTEVFTAEENLSIDSKGRKYIEVNGYRYTMSLQSHDIG